MSLEISVFSLFRTASVLFCWKLIVIPARLNELRLSLKLDHYRSQAEVQAALFFYTDLPMIHDKDPIRIHYCVQAMSYREKSAVFKRLTDRVLNLWVWRKWIRSSLQTKKKLRKLISNSCSSDRENKATIQRRCYFFCALRKKTGNVFVFQK